MLRAVLLQTTELISIVLDYLAGGRSLQEMETWVLEHLQEILDTPDVKAIEVVNQIDSLLVEKGEGLLTEDQLKSALHELIQATSFLASGTFNASHTAIHNAERDFSPSLVIRVNQPLAMAVGGTQP